MRPARTLLLVPVTLAALLAAAPAAARTTITPYLQVEQVFDADLSGGHNDNVTYTGVGAGVDVHFDSAKLQGQIDYQYDHYFAWSKRYQDTDLHSGLARLDYQPTANLTLSAAGIATRARGSLDRASPGLLEGDFANTNQVYGIQAGPSYAAHLGDVDVAASYRFGWVRSSGGGGLDLGPGQPVLENDFTDTSHTATASVGQRPGTWLPFGWTVSGGYVQDQVHFLDARFTEKFGRLDIVQPVTPTLALEAGAGYQADSAGQDALLTDANGNALLTADRHLRGDPSRRVLSYDQSGLVWDVGVLWRPSSRTSLEVRGGQRYGQTVVTGSFTHQLTKTATIQVVAYDDITSFGRQLSGGIGGLGTSFASPNVGAVPVSLTGCVFGANGGAGGCLPGLSSVNSNFYRSRGVYAMISAQRGPWTYGLGVNYDNRHYFAPAGETALVTLNGLNDDTVTVDGVVRRKLSENSSVSGTVYVAWYKTGLANDVHYTTYGATGSYDHSFSRRLTGDASISVYSGSGGTFDQDVIGSAMLGVRYAL